MNKPFSLTTLVVSYGLALGLFALLCPEGEMAQGLVFQVIVLVLASEAWNFLWGMAKTGGWRKGTRKGFELGHSLFKNKARHSAMRRVLAPMPHIAPC